MFIKSKLCCTYVYKLFPGSKDAPRTALPAFSLSQVQGNRASKSISKKKEKKNFRLREQNCVSIEKTFYINI